jgi:hypothetical protein
MQPIGFSVAGLRRIQQQGKVISSWAPDEDFQNLDR